MFLLRRLYRKLLRHTLSPWPAVSKKTWRVSQYTDLCAFLGWKRTPDVTDSYFLGIDSEFDLNRRRWNDALVVGGACSNTNPGIVLEIGTAFGNTTALMAENAPSATVYTVNIAPDEIDDGGKLVTFAPGLEEIGSRYRRVGCRNVVQILANTATWRPDFGPIDVAFVDGCHDAEFVYGDTRLVLEKSRPGTIIMWHDFAPERALQHTHLSEVLLGLNRLLTEKYISGPILHLQDSFTGLYVVPGGDRQ